MLVAVLAEFLELDAVWMIALVLCCRIVALFAACASHRNDYAHVVHLLKTPFNDKKRRNFILKTYAYLGLPKTLYHTGNFMSMKFMLTPWGFMPFTLSYPTAEYKGKDRQTFIAISMVVFFSN